MRISESDGRWAKWLGIALAIIFVGSIIWSILFETLLPLWRVGEWQSVAFHLAGIPLILVGTGLIVYGGYLFVRDTFGAMSGSAVKANVERIRTGSSEEAVGQAQRENFLTLLRAWRPGTIWMVAGFGLIAVGGFLINL